MGFRELQRSASVKFNWKRWTLGVVLGGASRKVKYKLGIPCKIDRIPAPSGEGVVGCTATVVLKVVSMLTVRRTWSVSL